MSDKAKRLREMYESGKLDALLDTGKLSQEEYDKAVSKASSVGASQDMARASALGMPEDSTRPAPMEVPQRFKVAPSGYVVGKGDMYSLEDGSEWEAVKADIPGRFRDSSLLPSRSAIWFEPSDEEVDRALRMGDAALEGPVQMGDAHINVKMDLGDKLAMKVDARQRYRDARYNQAYEESRNRGESIYRARDINESSPAFLRAAKAYAEMASPVESFMRGADRALTGGAASTNDTGALGVAKKQKAVRGDARGIADFFGVQPPSWAEEPVVDENMEAAERVAQRNVEGAERVIRDNPGSNLVGNLVGGLAPSGLTGRAAGLADKAFKTAKATGAISGMARGALSAATGDFGAELAAQQFEQQAHEAMGREAESLITQAGDAGKQALMSGALGGVMSIPGGVSRGMRNVDTEDAAALRALEEGGGGTQFWSMSGLRAPTDHEALAKEFPAEGAYAGARSKLANSVADKVIMPAAERTMATVEDAANRTAQSIKKDGIALEAEVRNLSEGIVDRQSQLVRATDEQAMSFTKKFMKKAHRHLEEGFGRRQAENEAALKKEGAPEYPAPPGPGNYLSDIEEATARAEKRDYGLETPYPSASVKSIIDKHYGLVQRLAFADGTHIPNTSALKFKKAMDALTRKKTVTEEEVDLFKDVAIDIKKVESEIDGVVGPNGKPIKKVSYEVLLPRRVSARELDDFIKAMDEMGKFPNSPAPEAARFREIGAEAAELRESAFGVLHETKLKHHPEILEDERMLRSVGLAKNTDKVDPMDVDQATSVLNNIKSYASTPDGMIPEGLAVPRREFERWLANHDEELYDEYSALRDMYRQRRTAEEFNIMADMAPKSKAGAYQTVEDAITGRGRKYEAIMQSFQSSDYRMRKANEESRRQEGLLNLFGIDPSSMSRGDTDRFRFAIHDILVNDQDKFERLMNIAKPEQRELLASARQAALDTDSMFTKLGFSKDKNRPGWSTIQRQKAVEDLSEIFDSYNKYGSKPEFNRFVDEKLANNPDFKEQLKALRSERAFQYLRRQHKEGVKAPSNPASARWYIPAMDFFRNHIDALMGYRQKGLVNKRAAGTAVEPFARSPFGAPTEYAMSVTNPVSQQDAGSPANTITAISAKKALEALISVVDRVEAEGKGK